MKFQPRRLVDRKSMLLYTSEQLGFGMRKKQKNHIKTSKIYNIGVLAYAMKTF